MSTNTTTVRELKELAPGFMDVVRARRSIRTFRSDPVPGEAVERLLEAASLAPSSCNRQPWRFVLVNQRELIRRCGEAVKARFDEIAALVPPGEMDDELALFRVFFSFFETAPLVVFACYREMPDLLARIADRASRARPDRPPVAVDTVSGIHPELQSLSLGVMSLVLAATNFGLATSVTTGPLIAREALEGLIGLSRHWRLASVIPVGFSAEELGPRPKRKDLDQIATVIS